MKAVLEDEELLCIVWAKTGHVSGHTILRYGSTHSYSAPSLAWDIHCGPVANNIMASSSDLGQVEASFIHKHEDVRGQSNQSNQSYRRVIHYSYRQLHRNVLCSPQVQYTTGHYSSGSKPGVYVPLCRGTTGVV